jgi:hypothetical protein
MPKLTPGVPLVTKEPVLLVENKLRAGEVLRFQLRVVDEDGNISQPDVATVRVGLVLDPRFDIRRVSITPTPAIRRNGA